MFGSKKYDEIRIRYLIGIEGSITYIFSHYYKKIKADSYDSLPLGKILALRNNLTELSQLQIKINIPSTAIFYWKIFFYHLMMMKRYWKNIKPFGVKLKTLEN